MLAASRLYVIPVLFAAVAVYVIEPAPPQRLDEAPNTNDADPTVRSIVTVCCAVMGPLHPAALAVMIVLPVHPAT